MEIVLNNKQENSLSAYLTFKSTPMLFKDNTWFFGKRKYLGQHESDLIATVLLLAEINVFYSGLK